MHVHLARSLALTFLLALPRPSHAQSPPADRSAALATARTAEQHGDLVGAESGYRAMLASDASDDEARLHLGRLLAHLGQRAEARQQLSAVLARRPADADARAALVDVALWDRRFDDADREINAGLALAPEQPDLLARRARLLMLRGDRTAARPLADRAEALAPLDLDIRTLRDRLYLGEARLIVRNQFFPRPGWDDLPSAELLLMQRVHRFAFGLRTEQSLRSTTVQGNRSYNGFYAGWAAADLAPGWTLGVEGGLGAPAPAVARYLARGFLYFPIHGPLDGYASYGYWTYRSGARVNLVNPAIGFQVTDDLRFEARYWLARVAADTPGGGDTSRVTHSVGAYGLVRLGPRITADLLYVYGTQIDRLPATFQLADVRSHILAASVDVLLGRSFGLRPLYGLEIRRNPGGQVINIHTAEIAAYARW